MRGGRTLRRFPAIGWGAIGVFVSTFILYLTTLAPTFGFIDKGELAAVAGTLGVAHPTGYPTFTFLGKLFTLILPVRDITALNILAALLVAAGGGVMTLLFGRMARLVRREESPVPGKNTRGKKKGKVEVEERVEEEPEDDILRDVVIPALAALITLVTGIWWRQSNGFEVYALHGLMLPLVTWLFLRYLDDLDIRRATGQPGKEGFTRSGFLFGLALGLSFTNHLTTILLAPAFLLYYFLRRKNGGEAIRGIIYLIPPFFLGLLPYIWLPLRAASDPRFNWGNPETLWAFWRHLTGAQYRTWMFTEPGSFSKQTSFIFRLMGEEYLYIGLAIALLGVLSLVWRARLLGIIQIAAILALILLLALYSGESVATLVILFVLLLTGTIVLLLRLGSERGGAEKRPIAQGLYLNLFLALLLLITALYAGGYDIIDIEQYYMAGLMAIGGWIMFGLLRLSQLSSATIASSIGGAMAVGMIFFNYSSSDESENYLIENASLSMLESLPPKAIVFSGLWDFWVSGSWYLQGVEKIRPDVAVIDYHMMKYFWYIDQLRVNYPEIMEKVTKEVDAFQKEQYKFEHDLPYDAAVIDRLYIEMIDAIIRTNLGSRPVLLTFDANEMGGDRRFRYGGEWAPPDRRIPYQLGYLIVPDGAYRPQDFPHWKFAFDQNRVDGYAASTYQWYATSARDRAQYEMLNGHPDLALRYLDLALSFRPDWNLKPNLQLSDLPDLPWETAQRIIDMNQTFIGIAQMREQIKNNSGK